MNDSHHRNSFTPKVSPPQTIGRCSWCSDVMLLRRAWLGAQDGIFCKKACAEDAARAVLSVAKLHALKGGAA